MNLFLSLFLFILGYLVRKYQDKISMIIKQVCFLLRNYNMIKKSKYYNEFYEDYISSLDYERSDIDGWYHRARYWECLRYFTSFPCCCYNTSLLGKECEIMIYVPENLSYNGCHVILDNYTMRVYETIPTINDSVSYVDVALDNHYLTREGIEYFGVDASLPTCISSQEITHAWSYRTTP